MKGNLFIMRVIAGTARRLPLVTPKGMDTRPTTDRIKETLFNMLQFDLPGCRFLDLFAGSGGIGIEALSRGASEAVFVDNSREAVDCIRQNLEKTKLQKQAEILPMDCISALRRLEERQEAFDIIFMDPPYQSRCEGEILNYLEKSSLVNADTQIIIEAALERQWEEQEIRGFEIVRIKEYKTNQHYFFRKKQ